MKVVKVCWYRWFRCPDTWDWRGRGGGCGFCLGGWFWLGWDGTLGEEGGAQVVDYGRGRGWRRECRGQRVVGKK